MISFDSVNKDTDFIQVIWTAPVYLPYWYQQTTSCRFLCRQETYYLTEVLIDSSQTSNLAYGLRPGSVCLIKLIAFYNPASIDPGIVLHSRTLYASKFPSQVNTCT